MSAKKKTYNWWCNYCNAEFSTKSDAELHEQTCRKRPGNYKFFKPLFFIACLIIVIGLTGSFVYNQVPNPFISKEDLLKKRAYKFNNLIKNLDFSGAYQYLDSETKKEYSKEEYIRLGKDKFTSGPLNNNLTIKKIVLTKNLGYVDRTQEKCLNTNCTEKKTTSDYWKWIWENGNWFMTGETSMCIRDEKYDMPPEFVRALSLFKQRFNDKYGQDQVSDSVLNCLNIEYSNLGEAEGLFSFDPNDSDKDKLLIQVDRSYQTKDDILTAILLSHEINHAANFIARLKSGDSMPCFEQEAAAYYSQMLFMASLNDEEVTSIATRILNTDLNSNRTLGSINTLLDIKGRARRYCGANDSDCIGNKVYELLFNLVKADPYYQKQCGNQ